jgi:hypothetical protein
VPGSYLPWRALLSLSADVLHFVHVRAAVHCCADHIAGTAATASGILSAEGTTGGNTAASASAAAAASDTDYGSSSTTGSSAAAAAAPAAAAAVGGDAGASSGSSRGASLHTVSWPPPPPLPPAPPLPPIIHSTDTGK